MINDFVWSVAVRLVRLVRLVSSVRLVRSVRLVGLVRSIRLPLNVPATRSPLDWDDTPRQDALRAHPLRPPIRWAEPDVSAL